ncbi:hypothetical protein F5144DRAFT_404410 [Chaetomium tenue]|uniref:Uncharacterized protein n=1 Tax=Chaetomium tenue TaxID=1854479 RepID=A0ACB7NVT8_9PEZI|nr:hypothetical protein F5144DRAFT_404410 [Chaetomium globosum]
MKKRYVLAARWVLTAEIVYAVGSRRVQYVCTHPIVTLASFVSLRWPARDDVGNLRIPYYQHASCSCNISGRLLQDTIREHCRIGRYPTNQGARDRVARVRKGSGRPCVQPGPRRFRLPARAR